MRNAFLILAFAVTVSVSVVATATTSQYLFNDNSSDDADPFASTNLSSLQFNVDESDHLRLTADKSVYSVGEPITITLKNIGTSDVIYPCHMYNLQVHRVVPPAKILGWACAEAQSRLAPNQEIAFDISNMQLPDNMLISDVSLQEPGIYWIRSGAGSPDYNVKIYIEII